MQAVLPAFSYMQFPTFKGRADIVKTTESHLKKEAPSFADINMIGKCNLKCFFCVGNELSEVAKSKGKDISINKNLDKHFSEWPNFEKFLDATKNQGIKKLYLTGSNTDPSQYKHLTELITHLKSKDFTVGIRTNGYFDVAKTNEILKKLNGAISYSIQSLNSATNKKICGESKIPDWENIISNSGDNVRVTIVPNRYNKDEILDMIKYLSKFKNIRYIQLRSIYSETDKFRNIYTPDRKAFDEIQQNISSNYKHIKDFKGCPSYDVEGKEVSLWDLKQNTINANNYYTDGTYHDNYFVVDGYSKTIDDSKNKLDINA